MQKLISLLVLFGIITLNLPCCYSSPLTVEAQSDGDDIILIVPPPEIMDATITLNMELNNMESPYSSPYTFDLHNYIDHSQPFTVLKLRMISPTIPHTYSYNFSFQVGNLGGHPDGTVYALPYAKNEKYRIGQGYFGSFSHNAGSFGEYAIDFTMPEGSTVCAAREGVVIDVRDDFTEGGLDKKYIGAANHIIIRHSDGTYAKYVHLKYKGSYVKVGDSVHQGDAIGLSGATGYVSCPHLHFEAFAPIDGKRYKSFPTRFQTPNGIVEELKHGEEY